MSRITRDIEAAAGLWCPGAITTRGGGFLRKLRRHPIPVAAHFRHSLVLTYAFREEILHPLLPPGLMLDVHNGWSFIAIAMVQTESLRPAFLPAALGQNFFLSGYRIFARYRDARGRLLRGLRILRSDTDASLMAAFGNLLTHYNYTRAAVSLCENREQIDIEITTPSHVADLAVTANLEDRNIALPEGSPFRNWHEARLFAGPLPFTFDYEPESHSIILIEGVRSFWRPRPVAVEVKRCTFFEQAPFAGVKPVLANAFYVGNIDYHWKRGVVETLPAELKLTHATA